MIDFADEEFSVEAQWAKLATLVRRLQDRFLLFLLICFSGAIAFLNLFVLFLLFFSFEAFYKSFVPDISKRRYFLLTLTQTAHALVKYMHRNWTACVHSKTTFLSICFQEEMARLQENIEKLKSQGSGDDNEEKVMISMTQSRESVGQASDCRAWRSRVRTPAGSTLRILKSLTRKRCPCNFIYKWLDFQVVSGMVYINRTPRFTNIFHFRKFPVGRLSACHLKSHVRFIYSPKASQIHRVLFGTF